MRDALLRSGYLLEMRVQALLQARGWSADTSVVYPDPITGKSRELDVRAYWFMREIAPWTGTLSPLTGQIMAECVNNPQPVVLVMGLPDKYRYYDLRFGGHPQYVLGDHPLEDSKKT